MRGAPQHRLPSVWSERTVLLHWVFLRTLYSSGQTLREVIGPQSCISPGAVTVSGWKMVWGIAVVLESNRSVIMKCHWIWEQLLNAMVFSPFSSLNHLPQMSLTGMRGLNVTVHVHNGWHESDYIEGEEETLSFLNGFLSCPLFKLHWIPLKTFSMLIEMGERFGIQFGQNWERLLISKKQVSPIYLDF